MRHTLFGCEINHFLRFSVFLISHFFSIFFSHPFHASVVRGENQEDNLDLLRLPLDPNWRGAVYQGGSVTFERNSVPDIVRTWPAVPRLVIGPTASSSGRQLSFDQASLSKAPVPITFMGREDGVVRMPSWDFDIYTSFEIEFITYEPRGPLFFV
ncbi:unnamed protein product [Protopolystoma xenopodis]|uniref:Uncharacterized protein n=1 Tax=Protopolystoma xenopodis TaxID=117903 RepID=A0A3S5AB60_9PLAT|nr:unnamed protein product [Protopolystoma xenopodis]